MTASGGTWSVDNPALAYQWNRDGAPIDGATAATYRLAPADAGAAITVTVTASLEGYSDGVATSGELEVQKLSSSTSGSASRTLVFGGQPLTYSVTVRSDAGLAATGEVAIYDGTRKLTTVTLDANGRASVPNLSQRYDAVTRVDSYVYAYQGLSSRGPTLKLRLASSTAAASSFFLELKEIGRAHV